MNNRIKYCITHNGLFHADDVFATAWLSKYFNLDVCENNFHRTNDIKQCEMDNPDIIIYDIGLTYSKSKKIFDHHQKDKPHRDNGYPYAAFGLIFQEYNDLPEFVYNTLVNRLVIPIELADNGMAQIDVPHYSINHVINLFNHINDDNNTCRYANFIEAVKIASIVIDKEISLAIKQEEDYKSIISSKIIDNHILVMDKCYSGWQSAILNTPDLNNILYVIYPGLRGGYQIQAVPDKIGSFGMRKPLPEEWRGKDKNELNKLINLDDVIFCHPAGFIGGAESFNSAIKMAKIAIQ